tara:strand:+ start:828 stop:1241 length:414 start_codon:yes stop_codon:yes gene_type:complete
MEEEKIIEYIKANTLDTAKRNTVLLDPRNYLIGILYYKHFWTEQMITDLLKKEDRSTICLAKDHPWHQRRDPNFLKNTIEVRSMFPFIFTEDRKKKRRRDTVTFSFGASYQRKLEQYQAKHKLKSKREAIMHLIENL